MVVFVPEHQRAVSWSRKKKLASVGGFPVGFKCKSRKPIKT